MNEAKNIFEVERDLQEKLSNKYRHFTTNKTEFEFGSKKVQIQTIIYEEFLGISEEEAKNEFKLLCTKLLETCQKYKIPYSQSNIFILTDDEINRGLQIVVMCEDSGYLRYIFIPPVDLKLPYAFWNYTFLHELGHCWINVQYDSFFIREVFADLISICTLKKIIPSKKKLYRDVIKTNSYIGGNEFKKYFGDILQQHILKDPESVLKKFMEDYLISN
jgi:hypothetical protein